MIAGLFSQVWIQRLGWTLLHFLWQGTAIAAIYGIVRGLTGRILSSQGRYLLACVTLIAMAIAPLVTFLLLPHSGDGLSGSPGIPWKLSPPEWQGILRGFVAVWLCGVLAFSIRLYGGWRFTARLRATSHAAPSDWQRTLEDVAAKLKTSLAGARPVRLLVSSLVNVPTVIGWLRPAILLPVGALTGIPPDHLCALLAHELAHIRRHDYLASVLQSIAEAVLFYHPAVWWISQQLRVERELCCDDIAVAASGDALTYAMALAQLESLQPPRLAAALAANGGSLVNRIRRLVEPEQPVADNLPGAGPAWAMTLLWMAGVGVATVHGAPTPVANFQAAAAAISTSAKASPFVSLPDPVPTLPARAIPRSILLFDPFLSAQVTLPPSRTYTASVMDKWLNEDVAYIIADEERNAFLQLRTDEERGQFIEQFWLRRDPTPGTEENEYKEEHYRRIAYANAHFGSSVAGWKTDRGRTYIAFGQPDEIQSHAGGADQPFPEEDWRYRYVDGQGNNVVFRFVDTANTGEFRIVQGQQGSGQSGSEFQRMDQFFKLQEPPAIKFKDLVAAASTSGSANTLPMNVQIDYLRGTDVSVLANVSIQFESRDLQFQPRNGPYRAVVNIFGRVTSMARHPVTTFEPTLATDVQPDMLENIKNQRQIYQQSVPLPPGRYHLNIVAKDIASGNMNVYEKDIDVPQFDPLTLSASSLILADMIDQMPAKTIGGAMFAIGDTKVRPRVGGKFTSGEKLGIYLQAYNFTPDPVTQKPAGSVEYQIAAAGAIIMDFSEEVSSIPNASASQVTIQKLLPLTTLAPGAYTLKVIMTDRIGNRHVQRQQDFTVSQQ